MKKKPTSYYRFEVSGLRYPYERISAKAAKGVAREMLQELLDLYESTDPKLGAASEEGKSPKALRALNIAALLAQLLAGWAEPHIFGLHYRRSSSARKEGFDLNDQANEFVGIDIARDGYDALSLEDLRSCMATFVCGDGWRVRLAEGLRALNAGEVRPLMRRSKTGRHGQPYTLDELRRVAVLHVLYLQGAGMRKGAARARVAAVLGITDDALRDWERKTPPDFRDGARDFASCGFADLDPDAILALMTNDQLDRRESNALLAYAILRSHPLDAPSRELREATMNTTISAANHPPKSRKILRPAASK